MNKLFILAFSLLCVMLSGCSGGQDSVSVEAEGADSASLRVGVLPTAHCLPLFVADKLGVFDKAGVDVSLVVYESAMDADTAFTNGYVQVLATDVAKFVHLRKGGEKLGVVLGYDMPLYLLASSQSGLESKEGLDEKVIAVARNSWVDMAADKIAESVGLTTEDLNRPQINSLNLRANMLIQNQFDGAILPEPWATICEQKGAVRLCDTSNYGLKMGVLVAQDSLMNRRAGDIALLKDAYDMAVDTLNVLLDSKQDVISYIPLPATLGVADSLLSISAYAHASKLSDSVLKVAEQWTKAREWLKDR